jgi:Flp pilus assembly secretin CpaC
MVRAFTVCAVILAADIALPQSATTAKDAPAPVEPAIAPAVASPLSACGEHECSEVTAATTLEKPKDNHALLKQKIAELNCLQSEIDALRHATGTPQAIRLNVKVVEVSRTRLNQIGVDIATLRGKPSGVSEAYTPTPTHGSIEFGTILDDSELHRLLERLRQNNVGKILSEPTMVIICDRPASLNVGGELPQPTAPGAKQRIEYKPYGTQIDVLAKAIGDDRVKLSFRAKVSDVDYTHAIEVSGVHVPALNVRQVDTGIELSYGQTGVLSGMVQRRLEATETGVKTAIKVHEIETMFFITPEAEYPRLRDESNNETGYRTADAASEAKPGERSLRVTKTNPAR